MKRLFTFLFTLAIAFPAIADDYRTWTAADGKRKVEARLDKTDAKTATMTTKDGKTATVKIDTLSQADQIYLREKRLADFKKSHTAWSVRTAGVRPQTVDVPSTSFGMDRYGRPYYGTEHHARQTTATFYYRQPFQGELVSINGTDVEISVWQFNRHGQKTGAENHTFKLANLGTGDRAFIEAVHKMEKGE